MQHDEFSSTSSVPAVVDFYTSKLSSTHQVISTATAVLDVEVVVMSSRGYREPESNKLNSVEERLESLQVWTGQSPVQMELNNAGTSACPLTLHIIGWGGPQ